MKKSEIRNDEKEINIVMEIQPPTNCVFAMLCLIISIRQYRFKRKKKEYGKGKKKEKEMIVVLVQVKVLKV